jgi:hypothetical protein
MGVYRRLKGVLPRDVSLDRSISWDPSHQRMRRLLTHVLDEFGWLPFPPEETSAVDVDIMGQSIGG